MDLRPFMERWHMLPPSGGVMLVAVSGGRDSVCLLHYLAAIAPQRGFTVAAGHLNHQMRPEARRDEDFVRSAVPEADFLGCIHYNPEIMDADRLGKSPYDFCPAAIEEIRKIKAIIDRD